MGISPKSTLFRIVIAVLMSVFPLSCIENHSSVPDDAVTVGLLLPFTGGDAAVGSNFEHAAILARDRINDAGGIGGHPMAFVTQDTHSDVQRAGASMNLIVETGVPLVIGPEGAEIARMLLPDLFEKDAALISPVISGADVIALPSDYTWVRLAPSASIMGRAFANYLIDQGVSALNVVYSSEDYHMDFAAALVRRFTEKGGLLVTSTHIDPEQLGFEEVTSSISGNVTDALVLSASAGVGSRLVNDLSVSLPTREFQWYLSPLLATPVFLLNTFNDAVEGAIGIAPDISTPDADFSSEYRRRWNDEPDDGAFFYYDAAAIAGMGMAQAITQKGDDVVTREDVVAAVLDVCSPNGIQVSWNEIERGLKLISEGQSIYYKGLTGPFLLDAHDDKGQQMAAPMKIWTVQGGEIVKNGEL